MRGLEPMKRLLLLVALLLACDNPGPPALPPPPPSTSPAPPPPPPPAPPVLHPVGTFVAPVFVASPPGDTDRVFVVEQAGRVLVLRQDTVLGAPFLDLRGKIGTGDERGLLSMRSTRSTRATGTSTPI